MTERKLATVRRIAAIDPIPGADKIECVTVDGWKLVSGKDNGFEVGDLVIYFEIDSFLPIREEFEWLRKSSHRTVPGLGEGFRIKTIKMRGQVSQGLIVPMTDFLQRAGDEWCYERVLTRDPLETEIVVVEEGADLTEFLGVRLYEKPIPANLAGRVKGNFPSFIRKTDQERAQNCLKGIKGWIQWAKPEIQEITDPEMIKDLRAANADNDGSLFESDGKIFAKMYVSNPEEVIAERCKFEATLKLDGSSMTIYHYDGKIGVCSRNLELKRDPDNAFWKCAIDTGLLGRLAQTGENIAIQGELMGPGVQGNREKLKGLTFWIFDIFDIDKQQYMLPNDRAEWWRKTYEVMNMRFENDPREYHNFYHVPYIDSDYELKADATIEDLLVLMDNRTSIHHAIPEGIVFKSHVEHGPSFKIISNKYLLEEKE